MLPDVKRVNLSEQLIDAMIELIENGAWEEGKKLPNEVKLAESFHVSRNIMREALRVLNSVNILNSHSGRGTFVSEGANNNIFRMRFFEELQSDSAVGYVLESRTVVEPELAALACRRCTDEEIAELRADVEKCMNSAEEARMNRHSFHHRIAELSGNPLLSNFLCSLLSTLDEGVYSNFQEKAAEINASSLQDHLRIVEAMELRDAELVKYLMYCHLKKRIDVISGVGPKTTDK